MNIYTAMGHSHRCNNISQFADWLADFYPAEFAEWCGTGCRFDVKSIWE